MSVERFELCLIIPGPCLYSNTRFIAGTTGEEMVALRVELWGNIRQSLNMLSVHMNAKVEESKGLTLRSYDCHGFPLLEADWNNPY